MKMRTNQAQKTETDTELKALEAALRVAQGDLDWAYQQFNFAVDPELVEYCVYRISAEKARCNYLLRAIKARTAPAAEVEQEAVWS